MRAYERTPDGVLSAYWPPSSIGGSRFASNSKRVGIDVAVIEQEIEVDEGQAVSAPHPGPRLRDKFGRAITDLRLSVTDRCNYRCVYCRTGNEGAQYTELPIADYLRMVRLFVAQGVEKVRLTGGEPLLRSGLVDMVAELAQFRTAYHPDGSHVGPGEAGHPLDL